MKDMPVSYHRILNRLEKQEERLLRRRPISLSTAALEAKVPTKVRDALDGAFRKAFQTLFGPGGTKWVEKTYPKEKLAQAHAFWAGDAQPKEVRQELRRMDRQGFLDRNLERCAAGVEGTVLGLLGVGLPDIPVMLALLLRSLYQTAARYGFSYESREERTYLLLVLQGALSQGEKRRELSRRADALGRALDHGWPTDCGLEEEIQNTSQALADRLLLVKFLQGVPLVGAVGGAANLSLSGAVSRYGMLKYKKRFLERKVRGL